MTWNPALLDGPITIPILGEPDAEGAREVLGYVLGYHLNAAPQVLTSEAAAFRVYPNTPSRVFSGAETVFLKFADEAEARGVLGPYWTEGE